MKIEKSLSEKKKSKKVKYSKKLFKEVEIDDETDIEEISGSNDEKYPENNYAQKSRPSIFVSIDKIIQNTLILSSTFISIVTAILMLFSIYYVNNRNYYPAETNKTNFISDLCSDSLNLNCFGYKLNDYEINLYPHAIVPDSIDFNEIKADVVYAYNPITHQVFYERNINKKSSIASITKLVTSLVMVETFNNETEFITSNRDPKELWKIIELKEGDKMMYEDVLESMLISSYNDVAYLVADNYQEGYDKFITEMNNVASEIGMDESSFTNPAGFDNSNNYSTARDLKKLVQKVIIDEKYVNITKLSSANVSIIKMNGEEIEKTIFSTNYLLGTNEYIQGLKTGSTENAGQCFIGYWKADEYDQLVIIILNSQENRFDVTQMLFDLLREVEYTE